MSSTVHRLAGVKCRTGLCRSSIYSGIKSGTFPSPIQLGLRAVGWLDSDITAWIESRPTAGSLVAPTVKNAKGLKAARAGCKPSNTLASGAVHDGQPVAGLRRNPGVAK